jgi:hypothetical protein
MPGDRAEHIMRAGESVLAKRPTAGKCVHCLKDPVERNWDHVFPESWYPDSSPENQYKWQIPSCIPCNSALGRIEEEFLRQVGLCLDPNAPASRSVVQKALRVHRPSAGKNERDRSARAALRKRTLNEALEGAAIPQEGTYPGMGERWDRPKKDQVAVTIPADSFRRLTEKIVRGIFFVVDRKFIEPPFVVEFFALDPSVGKSIREVIDKFGTTYARQPGIVVRRAVAPEDGISSFFEIEFWGQFKTYASVTRRS